MAAMSTTLTEWASGSNSKIWTTSGHTVVMPKQVIQLRRIPAVNASNPVAHNEIIVSQADQDADGNVLAPRVQFKFIWRVPLERVDADVTTAALAVIRDIVASDEVTAAVSSFNFVK